MDKILRVTVAASLFILGLLVLGFADETLTISTYYPSPYGVYKELSAYRMKIGPPPYSNLSMTDSDNGQLIVQGPVVIGKTTFNVAANPSLETSRAIISDSTIASGGRIMICDNGANGLGFYVANASSFSDGIIRGRNLAIDFTTGTGVRIGSGVGVPTVALDVAGDVKVSDDLDVGGTLRVSGGTLIYSCPAGPSYYDWSNCRGQLQTAPTCADSGGGSTACTLVGRMIAP